MGEVISLADRRQAKGARVVPPSRRTEIRSLLRDIAANMGVDLGLPPMPAGREPRC